MDPLVLILVVIVGATLVYLVVRAAQAAAERERQRLAALSAWASANGFVFSKDDRWNLDGRYHGIGEIGHGHDRYAYEVLYRSQPVPTFIFQYHYQTTETRTVTHTDSDGHSHTRTETYEKDHWCRYLIIELGVPFPSLGLRHENWGDKLVSFFGFPDINFESEEFSRRYHCASEDRQFAYAVIHPQMIEWLMDLKFEGQINRGLFIMDVERFEYSAGGVSAALAQATGFLNRIPPFVWQDYGKSQPQRFAEPVGLFPAAVAAPAN